MSGPTKQDVATNLLTIGSVLALVEDWPPEDINHALEEARKLVILAVQHGRTIREARALFESEGRAILRNET